LAKLRHQEFYAVYLRRCIVPQWGEYELRNVKTIEIESWLRRLHLAKSSCSKNLMSVLFNHACRYELFDHNPIRLVRQGAKLKTLPNVLTPIEIKALSDRLGLRERTLVLLATSIGLRQSELFGLMNAENTPRTDQQVALTPHSIIASDRAILAVRPFDNYEDQAGPWISAEDPRDNQGDHRPAA